MKVPHIRGLRVSDLIEFAEQHVEIKSYLPEYKTERFPSRQWVWNMSKEMDYNFYKVATLVGKEFKEYVKQMMEDQEKEYISKRNTKFKILPEFASLIKKSNQLSSMVTICIQFRGQRKIPSASKQ